MPKMKTSRSTAKRVRFTASGKIKRAKAGKRHLLTKKNRKRKSSLRRGSFISKPDVEQIRKLLPYG
ncbi:MAG: 50S ribosomal protein L35 [Candidatus Omnitrophica bacterium]|jgi:large subunit ribosomal protein L35|nr:50S ribosomal protein L35 [Candidatus Omnitrophota bacterium]